MCYLKRRRIGAYLDGALHAGEARAVRRHLVSCATCRTEADGLERLRWLVRQSVAIDEPDWTGFWPAVARGIESGGRAAPVRRALVASSRRLALAGTLAASLAALVIWQTADSPTIRVEQGSVVNVANTEHPDGSVMVYSSPGDDMTVIWVFGLDNSGASAI